MIGPEIAIGATSLDAVSSAGSVRDKRTRAGGYRYNIRRILDATSATQRHMAAMQSDFANMLRTQVAMQRDLADLTKSQGAMADAQSAFVEIETLKNPPWELWGCRRLLVATDAGLDRLLGKGAAGRVSDAILSSPQACTLVLRRLLRAVRWEVAKHAKKEDKAAAAAAAAGEIQVRVVASVASHVDSTLHSAPNKLLHGTGAAVLTFGAQP